MSVGKCEKYSFQLIIIAPTFKCLLFVNLHNSFCPTNVNIEESPKPCARDQNCSCIQNALPCYGVQRPSAGSIYSVLLSTAALGVEMGVSISTFPYLLLPLLYSLKNFIPFPLATFLSLEIEQGLAIITTIINQSINVHIWACYSVSY